MTFFPCVRLGSVCERITVGHVGETSPYYRDSGIVFLRTQNVGEGHLLLNEVKYVTSDFHKKLAKSQIRSGDVLISRVISDRVNCAVIPENFEDANCANVILIRPSSHLDSKYLVHFVTSPTAQKQLLRTRVGSAQSVINTKVVQAWSIPLPPIAQQRRIAEILDRADAVRRKRREAIELTEELLRSAFLEMFGDPGKNLKGWEKGLIADIAEKVTDGTHNTPERSNEGIMLLSARNIKNGYIDTSEAVDFIPLAEHERLKKSYAPMPHDVLISCSGSIGRVTAVRDFQRFSMVRSVAVVRPKTDLMNSEFLETLLHTNYLQMSMNRGAKQSSQANLFQAAIKELPVIIPPLEMQQKWEVFKLSLRETKSRYLHLQSHNENLFNSLLQRAFRGEL